LGRLFDAVDHDEFYVIFFIFGLIDSVGFFFNRNFIQYIVDTANRKHGAYDRACIRIYSSERAAFFLEASLTQTFNEDFMLKLSHANLTFFSGAIWMCIGVFLLQVGLNLLLLTHIVEGQASTPILKWFEGFFTRQESAIVIIALALYIGFLKGKYVLAKTVNRGISHIQNLPNPAAIQKVYGKKYFMLIAFMMCLGMGIKFFGVPNDIRGAIDVAVGAALIHGAIHYFRAGMQLRKDSIA
jgi:hypothetical protein